MKAGYLARLGRLLYRERVVVLLAVLALLFNACIYGPGIFGLTKNDGYGDPRSDSMQAQQLLNTRLGGSLPDVIILMQSPTLRVSDPAFTQAALHVLAVLKGQPEVASLTSYYSTENGLFISRDGHETFVFLQLTSQDLAVKQHKYQMLEPLLTSPVLHLSMGGDVPVNLAASQLVNEDLNHAETITFPLLLLLLLLVFGSVTAAWLPLLVGGVAIMGTFAILRLLTKVSDVSIYAVNVVTMLGLGLAIDYSLLIVTRFREELALDEHAVCAALERTMATAGRTVIFSALTVSLSLLSLLLFPLSFLRSMGLGAIAAVLIVMLTSLTLLPAILAMLGRHVNSLSFRHLFKGWRSSDGRGPRRRQEESPCESAHRAGSPIRPKLAFGSLEWRDGACLRLGPDEKDGVCLGPDADDGLRLGSPAAGWDTAHSHVSAQNQWHLAFAHTNAQLPRIVVPVAAEQHGAWYRLSETVMRWPLPVALAVLTVLLTLGWPFLHINFATPDENVLPTGQVARVVSERLQADFAQQGNSQLNIAVTTPGNALAADNLASLASYVQGIAAIPGVEHVTSLVTVDPSLSLASYQDDYAHLDVYPQLALVAAQLANGNLTKITVVLRPADHSQAAIAIVNAVRALPAPRGLQPLVDGITPEQIDLLASLDATLPAALLVIILTIFVLLFFMTGSLIMPLKAIVLNILSLSATFGGLVWIFQDGHLQGLLNFQTAGSIDATLPVLIFAIAFGLSMDYEVFLLSRIKERFDQTGDNRHAVSSGLQRTGWLITSEALLLATVLAAFGTAKIIFIQEIGIGLAIAVVMDATLIRMLLVPATMRLLGNLNWWAPVPLRHLWQAIGLSETPVESLSRRSTGSRGKPVAGAAQIELLTTQPLPVYRPKRAS